MDENNGTPVVAESSPAAEAPVSVEVPRDSAAYTHWRMTGETPAAKAAPEKPKAPASKKESSEAPAEGAENNAPASEAGSPQEKKARSTAETRLNEVLADLRRAGLSPSELKTFKREAQAAEAQQPKPEQAKSEQTVKPPETKADPAAPVRPEQKDYDTWDKWEAAKDKYHDDVAEYKAQKAVADYRAQQQQQAAQQTMQAKFAEAKQRYGDEAETTIVSAAKSLAGDAQIPAAVKAMFEQSAVMTDLLYVMGSKPAEFDAFIELARTNPAAAIRKMVLTESLVTAELGKATKAAAAEPGSQTAERDDTGKFTPAKKVTSAPPPPREAAGRSAPPADEGEAAALAGDFRRFAAAENRKDVAAKRGR